VSLPTQVVQEIRPLVEGRASDEWLFTAVKGGPIRHDHFHERVWKPTLDALNARKDTDGNDVVPLLAKRPRIHDLRHTHASGLIARGVPLTIIQRRLGHEDISTTSNVYGHLAPDHLAVAAAAAGYALVQAVPELEG
jgi:integrase